MPVSTGRSGTTGSAGGGTRNVRRSDGVAGFGVTLFFVFMLIYFAIFLLMFCTVATTLIGMVLLSLALAITIGGYLAGA